MWNIFETSTRNVYGVKVKNRQIFMFLLYVMVVFVGSVYHTLFGRPRDTFFSDKKNFLNMYFVKWGWGWTSIPLLVLMPLLAFHLTPTGKDARLSVLRALMRWTGATMYWYLLTQWCFGQPVFDRVLHRTGTCTLGDGYNHHRSCKKDGGSWMGFDISGHCLLLIHASLVLIEETRILLRHPEFWVKVSDSLSRFDSGRRRPKRHHEMQPGEDLLSDKSTLSFRFVPAPDRDNPMFYMVEIFMAAFLFALLMVWFVMLTATSTYFHTWEEKVIGTIMGGLYW